MKLYFKQRFFSWFDSYDVFDGEGNTLYRVKGQLAWGHKLNVYDPEGNYLGTLKEKVFVLTPTFEVYLGKQYIGGIRRRFFTLIKAKYDIDYNGWYAEGNFLEWDYKIFNSDGSVAAAISKQLFHLTDVYTIDVADPCDALCALMFVLAIDAEKCSRS